MRGIWAKVLILVGTFLLTLAAAAAFWVPGQVKKTPLDVDSTTKLTGEARFTGGSTSTTSPIKITSITRADSDLSTDDVVYFVNSQCVVKDPDGDAPNCVTPQDPDKRLVSASTDAFATDRRTALAVSDYSGLPAEAAPREGLINKFPFDVEKKTYPFWDSGAGKAVDAVFVGEEVVDSLNTYVFKTDVKGAQTEIAAGVSGTYDDQRTMWIDPTTGSIIDQDESRVLSQDGNAVVELSMKFTPDQVRANVEDAQANGSRLSFITSTFPLVGGLLGLAMIVVAILLARAQPQAQAPRHGRDLPGPQDARMEQLV